MNILVVALLGVSAPDRRTDSLDDHDLAAFHGDPSSETRSYQLGFERHDLVRGLDQHRVVRRTDHRQLPLVRRTGEEAAAQARVLLVEAGGGLVDEQQLHVGGKRAGDRDALALACGQPADGQVEPPFEPHLDERVAGGGAVVGGTSQAQAEPNVLERREVRDEPRLLRHECDVTAAELRQLRTAESGQ